MSTEVASMLDAVSPPWKLFLAVKVFSPPLVAKFDKLVLSNAKSPQSQHTWNRSCNSSIHLEYFSSTQVQN